MRPTIAHLGEITDLWLSGGLQQPVQILERRSNSAFNSAVVHLTVRSESPDIPERLIVKLNANGDGEYEIRFYQLAQRYFPLPHPRTLAFAFENGFSTLIQEDLSATHKTPVSREDVLAGRGIPSATHLRQMTETLARFHAYWWEHPALKSSIPIRPWYGNEVEFRAHVQRRQREWAAFTAKVEDFPEDLRQLYTDALAHLPQLWTKYLASRVTNYRGLTMSNGDCYFAQFLCPINENGQAYLVDFQEASGNFCAFDLVFMFAVFWTPEQRREGERESGLLRHYYKILCQNGVTGYTWENLLEDYRLMLALIVFFPIFDAVSGAAYDYWWPKMQCLVANFRDLDCRALFD
jgi:Ecdysteroid kinase-like family